MPLLVKNPQPMIRITQDIHSWCLCHVKNQFDITRWGCFSCTGRPLKLVVLKARGKQQHLFWGEMTTSQQDVFSLKMEEIQQADQDPMLLWNLSNIWQKPRTQCQSFSKDNWPSQSQLTASGRLNGVSKKVEFTKTVRLFAHWILLWKLKDVQTFQ